MCHCTSFEIQLQTLGWVLKWWGNDGFLASPHGVLRREVRPEYLFFGNTTSAEATSLKERSHVKKFSPSPIFGLLLFRIVWQSRSAHYSAHHHWHHTKLNNGPFFIVKISGWISLCVNRPLSQWKKLNSWKFQTIWLFIEIGLIGRNLFYLWSPSSRACETYWL